MSTETVTMNNLAYDLMEYYRATIKDSDNIDIRECYFWVTTGRAKILKQKLDRESLFNIDENYFQTISPIEMEIVDSSVVTGLPSDRYVSRTKVTIPPTLERTNYIGTFKRIGPADRLGESYSLITYNNALVFGNGKFNHDSIAAFLMQDRIYLISKNSESIRGIKYLDIVGIFQDPITAAKVTDLTYTMDDPYPVNANIVDDIKMLILKGWFNLTNRPPLDTQSVNPETIEKKD
jgi:hypothetical protein